MAEASDDCVHIISEEGELYCDPCGSDNKQTPACGFCENCNQFICDSCIKQHKKFAGLQSHTILDQSHMPSKRLDNAKTCIQLCGKHPKKKVKYFCKRHQKIICSVCMNLEHQKCKLEYIPVASKNFGVNREYLDIKEELETLIRTVRTKLSNTTTERTHIKKVNSIEIGLMADFLIEVQECLTKDAKRLINSSVTIHRNNTSVVETVNSVCSDLQEMRLSLSRVENNNSQLFMLAKTLDKQIRDMVKVVADIGIGHGFYDLRFIKDVTLVNFLKTPNALGTIETTNQDIFKVSNDKHDRTASKPIYTHLGINDKDYYHKFRLTSCMNLGDMNCGVVYMWDRDNRQAFRLHLSNRPVRAIVPTHLLIRPDGKTLEAFGYEAKEKYLELAGGDTQNEWYFFQWFWQQLNGDMTEIDIGLLSMVTESEAAAFYCLHLDEGDSMDSAKEKLSMPAPGTPFIVCFFKEDRLDMNLHKIEHKVQMRHLITEQEMTFGLSNIHGYFERLINSLAGCEVMTSLKNEHYDAYMMFAEDLKTKLHRVQSSENIVTIRIPRELLSCVKVLTGRSLEEHFETSMYKHQISIKNRVVVRMCVDASIITSIFDSFIGNAVGRIKTFVAKHCTNGIRHAFIVSEEHFPELIQEGVKSALSGMQVFYPQRHERMNAVLHGGALCGQLQHQ